MYSYSDISSPYHTCSKIWTSTIYFPMLFLKTAGWVAMSVVPGETLHSHLGLYCLLRPVSPNTYNIHSSQYIGSVLLGGLICWLILNEPWDEKWSNGICGQQRSRLACLFIQSDQGPVVQSVISLMSSFVVNMLTVLVSTIQIHRYFCWKNE